MSQSAEWRLIDLDSGRCIAERVELAASWWNRLRGLIGRKEFCAAQALVLRPCSAIHTIGMRFPIDVLFLDPGGQCNVSSNRCDHSESVRSIGKVKSS
jgi:uncharacterized membrane protein (UPF0127 family)